MDTLRFLLKKFLFCCWHTNTKILEYTPTNAVKGWSTIQCHDYKCRTYFFVYRCHKPIRSYMMSPAGSLPPLDMKDNMSRLVLSRCENWLFKQFASLCCCCWTRQSRTGPAERFWVECSTIIQFVHLVPA